MDQHFSEAVFFQVFDQMNLRPRVPISVERADSTGVAKINGCSPEFQTRSLSAFRWVFGNLKESQYDDWKC